jgi:hypothetical protein
LLQREPYYVAGEDGRLTRKNGGHRCPECQLQRSWTRLGQSASLQLADDPPARLVRPLRANYRHSAAYARACRSKVNQRGLVFPQRCLCGLRQATRKRVRTLLVCQVQSETDPFDLWHLTPLAKRPKYPARGINGSNPSFSRGESATNCGLERERGSSLPMLLGEW